MGGEDAGARGPFGCLKLDLFDEHGLGGDAEHAGAFARRRAKAACELREVVRGVEAVARLREAAPLHQVVPLRDEVSERASLVTERDTAAHATRGLLGELLAAEGEVDLPPVPHADFDGPPPRAAALVAEETARVSHGRQP